MLIAATPGDNAGLEFDLCRRNRRLPAAAGWGPSSKFVPPWGLCGARFWLVASRGLGARVRGAAQDPCAVHAALTMNGPGRACSRVSYLYRPLAHKIVKPTAVMTYIPLVPTPSKRNIDGDRSLHKKRLDVVGVEHDLLELFDRVPP